MAISDEQANFDARFTLITARFRAAPATRLPRCEDLTEQDFSDDGGLTFSGVGATELRRLYELKDRWRRGDISFHNLTTEPGRGDPGE